MRVLVFCFVIIMVQNIFAQKHEFARANSSAVSIERVGESVYKLTDKLFDLSSFKNTEDFSRRKVSNNFQSVDTTVFDQAKLDTSVYSGKYVFWQDVIVATPLTYPPVAADLNGNNRAELYGLVLSFNDESGNPRPMYTYELNLQGKFSVIHQHPLPRRVNYARNIVDIDGDGKDEIHLRLTDSIYIDSINSAFPSKDGIYKKVNDSSLATQLYLKYKMDESGDQRNDPTWGDFDNDGKKDLVFLSNAFSYKMILLEYNPATQYLDSIYSFDPQVYTAGYSVGDFDSDGKIDIVMGSIGGKIFVVENQGDNSYQNVWQLEGSVNNAYMHFWTNDIDGNGKKEFWVGGDGFFNGLAKTRFTAYESTGDNSYQPVGIVDIDGIFSLVAGNCFAKDITGDEVEEIFFCLDQSVFLLKFNGGVNHHKYSLLYYKFNELANQFGQYSGATLHDLDFDGKNELLVSQFQDDGDPNNGRIQYFTRIYKLQQPLNVNFSPKQILSGYEISQNYPNPFNPSTSIRYALPQNDHITIKIFSMLGKEIKTVVDQYKQVGTHSVVWDGRDNNGVAVMSGVYFIQIKTPYFQKTIKSLLLK